MQGTIIRLAIVGVIFALVGIFPPFERVEYNLAVFLVVIVAALIAEVIFATAKEAKEDPVLVRRIETFKQQSRLRGLTEQTADRPGPMQAKDARTLRRQADNGSSYDPIAASRLDGYYAPTTKSTAADTDSNVSDGGDGGGGGD